MTQPSLLTVLTAQSFLQTAWPPGNPSLAIPLLLLLIMQYKLVDPTPPLRAHALKSATVTVFLQAVVYVCLLAAIFFILSILGVSLFAFMLTEPSDDDYLIAAFQKAVRNLFAIGVETSAEMVMSVAFAVLSSIIHGSTALSLTSSYALLLIVPRGGREGSVAVRPVRVEDILTYGWTGALGMQTSKAIFYAWMGWRWMFFWPVGATLDPVFELVAVAVWQMWVSLAVAKRDVVGSGNAMWNVVAVCVLKTCLDLTSLIATRGGNWETAAAFAGICQVGLTGLLCWRRYQCCRSKTRPE